MNLKRALVEIDKIHLLKRYSPLGYVITPTELEIIIKALAEPETCKHGAIPPNCVLCNKIEYAIKECKEIENDPIIAFYNRYKNEQLSALACLELWESVREYVKQKGVT